MFEKTLRQRIEAARILDMAQRWVAAFAPESVWGFVNLIPNDIWGINFHSDSTVWISRKLCSLVDDQINLTAGYINWSTSSLAWLLGLSGKLTQVFVLVIEFQNGFVLPCISPMKLRMMDSKAHLWWSLL